MEARMSKLIDLLGKHVGDWEVFAPAPPKTYPNGAKHSMWWCRCKCGTERPVRAAYLNAGVSTNCGCVRKRRMSELGKKRRLASGLSLRNIALFGYKKAAAKRKLEWGITDELFDTLTQSNCRYCGNSPTEMTRPKHGYWGEYKRNGIDRWNNERGYVPANVVPCCVFCNKAKGTLSAEEFIARVQRIAQYMEKYPMDKV